MSLFHTLDRTSSTAVTFATSRPTFAFLCPALLSNPPRRTFHRAAIAYSPNRPSVGGHQMDTVFFQALARAGLCREHAKEISTLRKVLPFDTLHCRYRRKSTPRNECRNFESHAQRNGPFKKMRKFAEGELRALVDYYGIKPHDEPEQENYDDGPLIWNVGDDHVPWPVKEEAHQTYIERLEELLENEKTPHKEVFECYKLLPTPGVVYLESKTIRALLHHLSIVERADRTSMQRFLSILDDMKAAHIHITRSEWTSAIYFAGRFMGRVSENELQSALFIWRDMEKRAGIRGGIVTLNVLFDVAVKAGKFALAEMFLKEVEARRLKLHRHFRVSLLYYYGVKQNGDSVRQTYQELVAAGDVVDTVVMNAVIAALIRAGEPTAAEHVFERMKRLNALKEKPREPPLNWRRRRAEGLRLTWEAQRPGAHDDNEAQQEHQDNVSILPDSHTYSLIIRHHASTAGNIDRVFDLLQEMRHNSVPVTGTTFIVILYGFHTFGGVRYTSWSRDKLERIWYDFLLAAKIGEEQTWLSRLAVVAALKAFKKCTDTERTLRAWSEVREFWDPEPEELEHVLGVLRRLVPTQGQGFFGGNL